MTVSLPLGLFLLAVAVFALPGQAIPHQKLSFPCTPALANLYHEDETLSFTCENIPEDAILALDLSGKGFFMDIQAEPASSASCMLPFGVIYEKSPVTFKGSTNLAWWLCVGADTVALNFTVSLTYETAAPLLIKEFAVLKDAPPSLPLGAGPLSAMGVMERDTDGATVVYWITEKGEGSPPTSFEVSWTNVNDPEHGDSTTVDGTSTTAILGKIAPGVYHFWVRPVANLVGPALFMKHTVEGGGGGGDHSDGKRFGGLGVEGLVGVIVGGVAAVIVAAVIVVVVVKRKKRKGGHYTSV